MKKIGIVGGVAWPSTVEYYSEICRRSEQADGQKHSAGCSIPEIAIESLDLYKAVSLLGRGDNDASWAQFDNYHRQALRRLAASGAEFAVIASNTPHHRLASITNGAGIPVLSLWDAVAKEAACINLQDVLILGTALTMQSSVFRRVLADHGVRSAGPADQGLRMQVLDVISALQSGERDGAEENIREIATRALAGSLHKDSAVCLACTELPLAFGDSRRIAVFERHGVRYINALAVHIAATLAFTRGE